MIAEKLDRLPRVARAEARGAFQRDGRLVDAPVVRRRRDLRALSKRHCRLAIKTDRGNAGDCAIFAHGNELRIIRHEDPLWFCYNVGLLPGCRPDYNVARMWPCPNGQEYP